MMKSISKKIHVSIPQEQAFEYFVDEISQWWPKEYTWSQQKLEHIFIDKKVDGLCSEVGPKGFRCDWGRILDIQSPKMIRILWQISSDRVPEPDPDKCSQISINFRSIQKNETEVELIHHDFEKHGAEAEDYYAAMNSEHGWEYILMKFKSYCES